MNLRERRLLFVVGEAGQAHVENLDHPFGVDQQVGRLDIAMNEADEMCMRQAGGRLADVIGRSLIRQHAA
jgi:hypothetical protein